MVKKTCSATISERRWVRAAIEKFPSSKAPSIPICQTRPFSKGGEQKTFHVYWYLKRLRPKNFSQESFNIWCSWLSYCLQNYSVNIQSILLKTLPYHGKVFVIQFNSHNISKTLMWFIPITPFSLSHSTIDLEPSNILPKKFPLGRYCKTSMYQKRESLEYSSHEKFPPSPGKICGRSMRKRGGWKTAARTTASIFSSSSFPAYQPPKTSYDQLVQFCAIQNKKF